MMAKDFFSIDNSPWKFQLHAVRSSISQPNGDKVINSLNFTSYHCA